MGATLPILARHVVREETEIAPRVALLYGINTLGAVAGTLATAFLFLSWLGLRGTIWIAVAANVLVFAMAALLARSQRRSPSRARAEGGSVAALRRRWILPLIAFSGFVSFSYEVFWTRLLEHILGGSIYAFAVMLSSVLLGIALGSFVAGRVSRDVRSAQLSFIVAQLGAAAFSLGSFLAADRIPGLIEAASQSPDRLWLQVLVSLGVLLPPAVCVGVTYPAAVRVLAALPEQAAAASGRAYSWNTLGAVLGALSCAYWTLPLLAFAGTIRALVWANLAIASLAVVLGFGWRLLPLAVPAAIALGLVAQRPAEPWRLLLTPVLGGHEETAAMRFFAVGRSATVLVSAVEPGALRLRTNGLPEALIVPDRALSRRTNTTRWLGALPALLRPETRSMVTVGLGGGVHLESIPDSVDRIDVIEIEAEVVEANRAVEQERFRDPLDDPRVHVVVNDARNALLLSSNRYDAVVAQASHPWTAGSASLYTREFFEVVASRLSPGGVFVQWMGPSFIDGALFRTLLATLRSVWHDVRVYSPVGGGFLFAASDAPFTHDAAWIRTLRERDPNTLMELGVDDWLDLEVALLLDESGCAALAEGSAINTDDRNLLRMRSPDVLRNGSAIAKKGMPAELRQLDPVAARRPAPVQMVLTERLLQNGQVRRAASAARSVGDPELRKVAKAAVSIRSRSGTDRRSALATLVRNTGSPYARAALAMFRRDRILAGKAVFLPDWAPDPAADPVLAGWRRVATRDWVGLRSMEPALAAVPASPWLGDEALWLRARWRLELGTERDRAVAAAFLDHLLSRGASRPDWLMTRARLFAKAGDDDLSLAVLSDLTRGKSRIGPATRRAAHEILDALDPDPVWDPWRRKLMARLAPKEGAPHRN